MSSREELDACTVKAGCQAGMHLMACPSHRIHLTKSVIDQISAAISKGGSIDEAKARVAAAIEEAEAHVPAPPPVREEGAAEGPFPAAPDPLGWGPFLTVAEVAAGMRVSKMTVYRLIESGDMLAVRVGRSYRVKKADAEEYLRGAGEW